MLIISVTGRWESLCICEVNYLFGTRADNIVLSCSPRSQWRVWTSMGRVVSLWSVAVTVVTSTCGTNTLPASCSLWRETEEEWWVSGNNACSSQVLGCLLVIANETFTTRIISPYNIVSDAFSAFDNCRWIVWSHIPICQVWLPVGWTMTSNCGLPQLKIPQDSRAWKRYSILFCGRILPTYFKTT